MKKRLILSMMGISLLVISSNYTVSAETTVSSSIATSSATSTPSSTNTSNSTSTSNSISTSNSTDTSSRVVGNLNNLDNTNSSTNSEIAVSSDPVVSVENYNEYSDTFDVNITGGQNSKTIKSVSFAVWTEENGQDDLHWFGVDASNNSAIYRFNISDFGNKIGNYTVHAYINYADGSQSGIVVGTYKISLYKPVVSVSDKGIQVSLGKGLSTGVSANVAVWSDNNDQDDLQWYGVSNDGTLIIPYSKLKDTGVYNVHTYISQDNQTVVTNATTVNVAPQEINISVTKLNSTQYKAQISNIPDYFSNIKVPIWSDNNGQDDLRWYDAVKNSSGNYEVTFNLSDHNYDTGKYFINVYGDNSTNNKQEGIKGSNFTVDSIVDIINYNKDQGTYEVIVSKNFSNKSVEKVDIAVWSESNQSNLCWYGATGSGNLFDAKINVANHKNISGTYFTHVYITYTDGTSEGIVLDNRYLSQQSSSSSPTSNINTYPIGQCTWGVKEQAPWVGNNWGNAGDWISSAKKEGFTVGTIPRVGAVAVWPYDGGGYGHVAYVIAVNSATSIQVKESNYAGHTSIQNYRGWFNPTLPMWGGGIIYYIYPKY